MLDKSGVDAVPFRPMQERTTEVWARNPQDYIKECVETGMVNIAWDYGMLRKRNIDPKRFLDLYFGRSLKWRALIIGDDGSVEIGPDNDQDNPVEKILTWRYGQEMSTLQKMIDDTAPEGRIVITGTPVATTNVGRSFYRLLTSIQEEHPDKIFHVHGLYSYRMMFGPWFRSVDFEPRLVARNGNIVLPTGKEIKYERSLDETHWVTLLGFRPHEFKIPRNRCMFNIKSAQWAAEHFKDAVKIKTKGFDHINPDDPIKRISVSRSIMVKHIRPREGDKLLCNVCSLQTACKYFREGAVCIVPESEPVELAKFFKTRSADDIIDGLGTLLATQTRRLEKAIESEEADSKLHSETTKIINTLFDRGVKLAKLVDPRLAAAGAPKLTANIGVINQGNPQQLMAAIVEEFAQRGIPREQITPEMILKVFNEPEELKQKAIEAAVIEKTA